MISLAEGQQEFLLRGEPRALEALGLARIDQGAEVDVGGQVGFSRRREKILRGGLAAVSQQRAAGAVRRVETVRPVPIIDGQHKAASQLAGHGAHPVLGLKVRLHAMVFLESRGVAGHVSCDGGVAERAQLLAQVVAFGGDVDLLQPPSRARHDVDRKGVHQFVREKAAGDGREFLQIGEQVNFLCGARAFQTSVDALALPGVRLHGDILQRGGEVR